ncbi:MAG: NAD(P)H-hydrate dehydratase [bacterium]|nr:NAD(P)H-hydrate dehydratase [bacterium]
MVKLPPRPVDSHKGTYGTLAVIGGQLNDDHVMLGSAAFAAEAALRVGVGKAIFVGSAHITTKLVELVPQAVGISTDLFGKMHSDIDAFVVGPGLGVTDYSYRMINALLELQNPTVIDADGLNVLVKHPELFKKIHERCVFTPHPIELSKLLQAANVRQADELAKQLGCTIVAKSHRTEIFGEEHFELNKPNPVLATSGSGDVLSGLIGGLLAQYHPDLSVFECAKLAVQIHSEAADLWRQNNADRGLLIPELIDQIPKTIQKQ